MKKSKSDVFSKKVKLFLDNFFLETNFIVKCLSQNYFFIALLIFPILFLLIFKLNGFFDNKNLVALFLCIILYSFFKFYFVILGEAIEGKRAYLKEREIIEYSKKNKLNLNNAKLKFNNYYNLRNEIIVNEKIGDGFLKILDYFKKTISFYLDLIFILSVCSGLIIYVIYLLSQSNFYNEIVFDFQSKTTFQIVIEGIFSNIRFFIYESLLVVSLAFLFKKIFNYVSMIEIYREWEIFLIMDVQKQNKLDKEKFKNVVSEKFKNNFISRLNKHENFLLKNKNDFKFKNSTDILNIITKLSKLKK